MAQAARSAVLGIGNVLLGDDAFGPYVVAELLAGWELPEGLMVLDAGTPGIDLADYLACRRYVVLVDSVRSGDPPGTLRVYNKADLLGHTAAGLRQGGHDPSMRDALVSLEMAGFCPEEVILVGAVPADTKTGTGLTPALREAAPRAVLEVVRQLASLGFTLRPRATRAPADVWWERTPSDLPA